MALIQGGDGSTAWPVKLCALIVPVAVRVCVCVASALPVKVSAGTVCVCVPRAEPVNVGVWAMAFATPPVVLESAPVVSALIVPAGVPPEVAPVVAVLLVPAGVPALTAEVVADVPVSVACCTVPAGVIVAFPPVVPTSPLAAKVPRSILPFRAEASVHPAGQEPLTTKVSRPEGTELEAGVAGSYMLCEAFHTRTCPSVGAIAVETAYPPAPVWDFW